MLMLVAAFVVFVLAVDFDSVGVGVAVPLISLLLGAALVLESTACEARSSGR